MAASDEEQAATESTEQRSEQDEQQAAREEMKRLEEADELPSEPKDWPDGKAKFLTFASDDDEPYGEGPTAKLGPGSLEHHEDGSVSVDGEKVDDPESYKGEPIAGGPTDPNAPAIAGERDEERHDSDASSESDGG